MQSWSYCSFFNVLYMFCLGERKNHVFIGWPLAHVITGTGVERHTPLTLNAVTDLECFCGSFCRHMDG